MRYKAPVENIEVMATGNALVETAEESFTARMVVRITQPTYAGPEFPVESTIGHKIWARRIEAEQELAGTDVLIVGRGDEAVSAVVELLASGANVVLSFSGRVTSLSRLARETIATLEHRREVTVLWGSQVEEIVDSHGFPMVYWRGRMTPALQFDHVVTVSPAAHDHSHEEPTRPILEVDPLADEEHALGPARVWDTLVGLPGGVGGDRVVTARPPEPERSSSSASSTTTPRSRTSTIPTTTSG